MAKRICQEIDGRFYANGLALAQFFGTTPSAITRLDQEGIISRTETSAGNLYDVGESVQGYIDKLTADSGLEDAKVRAERFKAEADLKKSKAVIAELEASELKGNMHRSEDVQSITEDFLFEIRNMLMNLPGQLAVEVNHAATAAECADIIRTHVNRLLLDMTKYRYDPAKYEERVRQRQNWETRDDEE